MRIFRFILVLFVLQSASIHTKAQGEADVTMGVTSEMYSIRADIQLEFSETIFCESTNDSISGKFDFSSPLFIDFNKADLENFLKYPAAFTHYADPLLSTQYVYSDYQGNNEIVPGFMSFNEVSYSTTPAESWSRKVSGEIETALLVGFSILNMKEFLNNAEKPTFTLMFKLDRCIACDQKNVSGIATIKENDGQEIIVTEGLSLDAEFSHMNLFSPSLGKAIVDEGLTETEGEKRDEFEENFKKQFYANAPKIDAEKMIRFLLQPSGTLEIPFEGSIKSDANCRQNNTFKGVIKVYGNQVYRFMSAE